MVLIQLGEFGLDPLSALRTFEANPASKLLSMSHVARVGGRGKDDWVGEGPPMQDVVDYTELVQRDLGQRGLLIGRIRAIGRENEGYGIMGGAIDSGHGQ
jgi:hypothetical protein